MLWNLGKLIGNEVSDILSLACNVIDRLYQRINICTDYWQKSASVERIAYFKPNPFSFYFSPSILSRITLMVSLRQAVHQRQHGNGNRGTDQSGNTQLVEQAGVDRQCFQRIGDITRYAGVGSHKATKIL